MSFGQIIEVFIAHNQTIFAVTLAVIFGLSGFLVYRLFFVPETSEATPADLARIEDSLRKILSQTPAVGAGTAGAASATGDAKAETAGDQPAAPTATGGTSEAPVASAASAELQKELEARTAQIEQLKQELEKQKAQNDTSDLLAKIKSLEERLAEYEIIEDDIADLSLYKEENAKLKKELEALRAAAGAANPAAEPPKETTADLVEEFESAVKDLEKQKGDEPAAAPAETAATPAPETPGPEAPASEAPAEAAVETPIMDIPAAAEPAAETITEPAAETPVEAKSDIFAEMQGESGQDLLAELGEIDADRMLEEIKDLGESMGDVKVLDEAVDLDKMASEIQAEKKG